MKHAVEAWVALRDDLTPKEGDYNRSLAVFLRPDDAAKAGGTVVPCTVVYSVNDAQAV